MAESDNLKIHCGEVRWESCRFGAVVRSGDNGELFAKPPANYETVESFVCINYFLRQEEMREKVLAIHPNGNIYDVALLHPRGRVAENKVQLALYQGCLDCPFYEPIITAPLTNRLRS